MDELSVLKLRLAELVRICGEAKSISDGFEKAAKDAEKQRNASESAVFIAKDEYRKLTIQASEYKAEFDRKKKSEYEAIEKDKKEAKQALDLAGDRLGEAEKYLESARSKDASAEGRLAEISKKELELNRKQEQVKAFVTNFK